jgi:hypothetical protein
VQTTQPQRIPGKPKLLDVINNNRQVTLIRLAQTAGIQRNELLAAIQSNAATPQIAERIVAGLTKLTNHRYSVLDIELSVHPEAK